MEVQSNKELNNSLDPYSGIISPIPCNQLKIISGICVFVALISISFNSLLIMFFIKYKNLRTRLNIFVIVITIINLIGTLSEFSFVIPSTYYCKWIFGKRGCYVSGFVMYTVGFLQIYVSALISIENYCAIYMPTKIKMIINRNTVTKLILVCFICALVFTVCPLFGWSYYSLEKSLVQCSVEWSERSTNVVSYNITIFSVAYLVPLSIIIYCNICILKIANNVFKLGCFSKKNTSLKKRKIAVKLAIFTSSFILAWTPYAIVSLISAFIDPNFVSPLGSLIPAIFAKSSMAWGAIFFVFSNSIITNNLCKKKRSQTKTHDLHETLAMTRI